ncbi:MAG: hypothetical protein H0X57_03430 [Rubrobacter sp.]|nr:hypothetical protein [Rubrobacter sp.]
MMDVREQVDLDYARARRRALVGRLLAWVGRRCPSLRAFDDARREFGAENRRYVGVRVVEVCRVVGSVGRWRDFDRGFMPTRASAGRWKRVDLAFRTGRDLPPVILYKVGGEYYVHDGNHRVSVARFEGVEMIDAEVTEFFPARRVGPSRAAC